MNPRIHNSAMKWGAGAFLPPFQGSLGGGVYPEFRLSAPPWANPAPLIYHGPVFGGKVSVPHETSDWYQQSKVKPRPESGNASDKPV